MEFSATNANGVTAKWISRGATLTHLFVPDRDGKLADVVLGFDEEVPVLHQRQFNTSAARRAAMPIASPRGKFTLDGVEYQLAVNNGPNHLHGGPTEALDKVEWQGEALPDGNGVRFTYTSPDGQESFPGTVELSVIYTLTDKNAIRIEYEATTDKPTILNLTNHSYFNLKGHGEGDVSSTMCCGSTPIATRRPMKTRFLPANWPRSAARRSTSARRCGLVRTLANC